MPLKPDLVEKNDMKNSLEIPLNLIFLGEKTTCPPQIIVFASPTKIEAATIQCTVNRQADESQEAFWCRVISRARELIQPYNYAHRIAMLCRYDPRPDDLSNDHMQNILRTLWFVAENDKSHWGRVKAACTLHDIYNKPNFRL